jgi:hypothetical protein
LQADNFPNFAITARLDPILSPPAQNPNPFKEIPGASA